MSIFPEGCRPKSDLLTSYQTKILKQLDQFDELRVVVKPFKGSSHENCSVMQVISMLENIEVIDDMHLTDCLKENEVRAIVSEYPSSPMFEVIGLDTEIFQLSAPNVPFSKESLVLLTRRVHWFEKIDNMLEMLGLWVKGSLKPKRDLSFYNKFLFKENTEDLILSTIEKCLLQKTN